MTKYESDMLIAARFMRKNAPPAEKKMWELLKNRTPNWRRQYRVDKYFFDFYCPRVKIAVQLGEEHSPSRDIEIREKYGVTTMRYSTQEFWKSPLSAVQAILTVVSRRLSSS